MTTLCCRCIFCGLLVVGSCLAAAAQAPDEEAPAAPLQAALREYLEAEPEVPEEARRAAFDKIKEQLLEEARNAENAARQRHEELQALEEPGREEEKLEAEHHWTQAKERKSLLDLRIELVEICLRHANEKASHEKDAKELAELQQKLQEELQALGQQEVTPGQFRTAAARHKAEKARAENLGNLSAELDALCEDLQNPLQETEQTLAARQARVGELEQELQSLQEQGADTAEVEQRLLRAREQLEVPQRKLDVLKRMVAEHREMKEFIGTHMIPTLRLLVDLLKERADQVGALAVQQEAQREQRHLQAKQQTLEQRIDQLQKEHLLAENEHEKVLKLESIETVRIKIAALRTRRELNRIVAEYELFEALRVEWEDRYEAERMLLKPAELAAVSARDYLEQREELLALLAETAASMEQLAASRDRCRSQIEGLKEKIQEKEKELARYRERRLELQQRQHPEDGEEERTEPSEEERQQGEKIQAELKVLEELLEVRPEQIEALEEQSDILEELLEVLQEHSYALNQHTATLTSYLTLLDDHYGSLVTTIAGITIPSRPLIAVPLLLAGILVLIFLIDRVFYVYLRRWAKKSTSLVDDHIVRYTRRYLVLVLLLGIPYLILNAFNIPDGSREAGNKIVVVFLIIFSVIYATKTLVLLLGRFAARSEQTASMVGPMQTILKIVFAAIGLMIVLDTLNISITPLLTTLGIGSVAVALALNDTLANFFAGLYVIADRPIRVGDYVKLDSGEEGYVTRIGWRSTRIRQLPNNIIVVPNSKITSSTITNYHLPEKMMSASVTVGVSYNEDPRRIETLLMDEVTNAAKELEGLLAYPEPFVRFTGFGDSSLDFVVIYKVREFVDQYYTGHELRYRIFQRFQKEGVEIPFPQRDLHLPAGLPGPSPAGAQQQLSAPPSSAPGKSVPQLVGGEEAPDAIGHGEGGNGDE